MPFSPRLTFDLAATGAITVSFSVDASDIGPISHVAIAPRLYARLVTGLTNAIRSPTDPTDATNLGTFVLLALFSHRTTAPMSGPVSPRRCGRSRT